MEIQNFISRIKSLLIVKQNDLLLQRLTVLEKKLERESFQLVVLGQFKRGKTTLINALFGENLLPTSIIPLTSIITIVKYGQEEKITVKFLDGKERKIKHIELADYVTESRNPKNQKQVEEVVLEFPSEFLKNNIEIIDTPGVGSVYKHNTDVAYEFVPKADAGIFVVTADPPISESELQFLKSIKDYLAKIIFVQNKIDQVEEKDRQESLEFSRKVIGEAVGKQNLHFIQLSAKLGLDGKKERNKDKLKASGLDELEDSLNQILLTKKEQVLKQSVAHKLLPIIGEIELQLQVGRKAFQMSIEELRNKIDIFNKEVERIKQEKEDNNYILQGQAEKIINQMLIDDIDTLKEKETAKVLKNFEAFFKENENRNGQELSKSFDVFLEKIIKTIFTGWRQEEEQKLQNSLSSIISRFSVQTNQFTQRVIDLSATLFSFKMKRLPTDLSFAQEIEFKFSFDEYQVDLDLYTPVVSRLPKFLSHKLLYKNMRDKIIQEIDKHCGRSRFDFHQRVVKSVNDYQNKLDGILEEIIRGIKTAMEKGLQQQERTIKREKGISESYREQEMILSQIEDSLVDIISHIN